MVFKVTIAIGAIMPAQPSGPIILKCFWDDQPSLVIIYDGCHVNIRPKMRCLRCIAEA